MSWPLESLKSVWAFFPKNNDDMTIKLGGVLSVHGIFKMSYGQRIE